MIRLDTTTRKLQLVLAGAVATTQLPVLVSYSDKTASAYTGATQPSNSNGTTAVDICAVPAAATVRDIDYLSVRNADTAPAVVTIRLNDNGTLYPIVVVTLAVGDHLAYTHGSGWEVRDAAGTVKTAIAGAVAITGGSISGIVDLAVADGGTGASTAAGARTNLGLDSLLAAKADLVGGVVPLSQLPAAAIERMVPVADQAARYALTTATVQQGDTVKQVDTGVLYLVVDEANLGNAAGYQVYTAGAASAVPWSGITGMAAAIAALAVLTPAANALPYFDGGSSAAVTTLSAYARSLLDDADAATARTTLGLGTLATQDANAVALTGGTVSGLTSLSTAAATVLAAAAPTLTIENSTTAMGVDQVYGNLDWRGNDASANASGVRARLSAVERTGQGATDLALYTTAASSTTLNEVMRLTSGQRVLIGTPTDDGVNRLQVSGNAYVSGLLGVGVSPLNALHVQSSTANGAVAYLYNTNATDGHGLMVRGGGSNSAKYVASFQDAAGNTRLHLLANGTIVVGGTTGETTYSKGSASDISVSKATNWTTLSLKSYSATAAAGGLLVLGHSLDANVGTQTTTTSGSTLGLIAAEGVNANATPAARWAASIRFEQDGAAGATYLPGRIIFSTGTNAADVTEAVRIDSNKAVTIGGVANAGAMLEVHSVASIAARFACTTNSTEAGVRWTARNAAAAQRHADIRLNADTEQLIVYSANSGAPANVAIAVTLGGRSLFGTTTDDGTNRLQVSGNAKVTGTLETTSVFGLGAAPRTDIALYIAFSAFTGTSQYGIWSAPTCTSAATSSTAAIITQPNVPNVAFTVGSVFGVRVLGASKGASATITNQHGVYIDDQTNGTNNYGLRSVVSSGANKWNIFVDGTASNYLAGSLGIGTAVFGASAAKVLALGNGATAPTTSVDLVHLYGEDISAGNAALAVYQEAAVQVAAGIASTHKIPVRWNGTTYYLLASNV